MKSPVYMLLRPWQWVKNAFVFLPMFFGRHLFDGNCWIPCLWIFVAFCFASSGIYCLNDIQDADSDRQHKNKCSRPIASGVISVRKAYGLMVLCWVIAACCVCQEYHHNASIGGAIIIIMYVVMNIAYCLKLKHFGILDVFIIALGFVMRVVAGGYVAHIELSHWIVLMTFLLALFIAFAKRRDDVATYENSGVKLRKNIGSYNLSFMNQALCILASITMVCYIMYTVSEEVVNRVENQYLYMTSIFVLAGILRYLQITIVDENSGSPTKILMQDRFIQSCIVSWIVSFIIILYVL